AAGAQIDIPDAEAGRFDGELEPLVRLAMSLAGCRTEEGGDPLFPGEDVHVERLSIRAHGEPELGRLALLHGATEAVSGNIVARSRKDVPEARTDQIRPAGQLLQRPRVEESEAPVSIQDEDAVGRAFENRKRARGRRPMLRHAGTAQID